MEQFRQVGEVMGSIKALMMFREEIRINQRQCGLLVDAFNLAFEGIAEEIKQHLKYQERLTKWKSLEHPLRELHKIFKEGENYIRQCLDGRDWCARAISLTHLTDCVEIHLHNLLWCIPVVIEAIECIAENSGGESEELMKIKLVFTKKYERDWMEPKLFQQKYGARYLISKGISSRLETAWKEDRWMLSELIAEKKTICSKQENRLAELLTAPKGKLFNCSVLVGSQDYQVRRRLGSGSNYKEIQWMGESFAAKHVIGDIDPIKQEILVLASVSHPNVMHCLYAFCDEEKRECYLLMELMSKDLSDYIKEMCSPRRRIPFALLVAVDIMLQIARGMEYLHSRGMYHGELNPSNILVKSKSSSSDGYLHVKVTGFEPSQVKNLKVSSSETTTISKGSPNQAAKGTQTTTISKGSPNQAVKGSTSQAENPSIWYAPEVLSEQESAESNISKYSEKADVYSFGMICFELLTGKIPFEDDHLQGDKMSRNIRAGERPLFPFPSPKYLTSLTKRCWQADPSMRPSFSTICRMLRYIKRFLIMNPDHSQPDAPVPAIDYFDLETILSNKFSSWTTKEATPVTEIPFQMYAYRVIERERTSVNLKDKSSESSSEAASVCEEEVILSRIASEDSLSISTSASSTRSSSQASSDSSKKGVTKKADVKKLNGQMQKPRTARPPQQATFGRGMRVKSESQLQRGGSSPIWKASGHASDSELA